MIRKRIYYTVRGEQQALRPYPYATEDGKRWTFYAKNRHKADLMAAAWAKRRGSKIYRVKKRRKGAD